ncbi:hypothetical protein GCM10020000_72260 [Streptomyces olivoverticillatus]
MPQAAAQGRAASRVPAVTRAQLAGRAARKVRVRSRGEPGRRQNMISGREPNMA